MRIFNLLFLLSSISISSIGQQMVYDTFYNAKIIDFDFFEQLDSIITMQTNTRQSKYIN